MSGNEPSAIVRVVFAILRAQYGAEAVAFGCHDHADVQHRVVSYNACFASLWEALAAENACSGESVPGDEKPTLSPHMFVVWDTTPIDGEYNPVPTNNYLSPVEWALCAKIHAGTRSDLRITILDANPDAHESNKLYGYVRKIKEEEIPWLRLASVRDLVDAPAQFLKQLYSPGSSVPQDNGVLEELKRLERLVLTETGPDSDRHAISNIVGPIVLLGNEFSQGRLHAQPLKVLLGSVGLLSTASSGRQGEEATLEQINNQGLETLNRWVRANSPVNFILIDDQAHHGWAQWLEKMTKGCGKVLSLWDIHSSRDPGELLVNYLSQQLAGLGETVDLRFRLSLAGAAASEPAVCSTNQEEERGESCPEILFIDLRLFSGADERNEISFIKKLVGLARRFTAEASGLAWKGFDLSELDEIERWTELSVPDKSSACYFKALTLLPRLLSLADMSYPVVLFSSTGQRSIIEHLRPYANILTDFDKPRFFTLGSLNAVSSSVAGFWTAISHALLYLEVRASAQKLLKVKCQRDLPKKSQHCEIYIDESGTVTSNKSDYYIGGFVALYNTVTDAKNKCKKVRRQGLKWYGKGKLEKNIRSNEKKTQEVANKFLEILGKDRVLSFAFYGQLLSLQGDFDITDLSHERSLDNLHMRTVRLALESLIYDVLPLLINENASISVYVATRQRWFTEENSTTENQRRLLDRWAIQAKKDERGEPCLFYKSIRNDFFPSFFSQILAVRKQTRPPAIETGCGVTFTYGDSPPDRPFRHVHYVADMIAYNMRKCSATRLKGAPAPWKEWTPSEEISPIIEETDERFLHVLSASRDIQSGERVLALLKLFVGVKNLDASTVSSYERFAVGPIQRGLIALTGEEFIRLCKLIALSNQGGRPVYDLP